MLYVILIVISICVLGYSALRFVRYSINYSKSLVNVGMLAAQSYIMFGNPDCLAATRIVNSSVQGKYKVALKSLIDALPVESFSQAAYKIESSSALMRRSEVIYYLSEEAPSKKNTLKLRKQLASSGSAWLFAIQKPSLDAANKPFSIEAARYLNK